MQDSSPATGLNRAKPRTDGLTATIDKGLGPNAVQDLLATASEWLDVVKLGWTTPLFYSPEIRAAKIRQYQEAGVLVTSGGTMMEYAWQQRRVEELLDWLLDQHFDIVEIANGLLEINPAEKAHLIAQARKRGLAVWSEVGKKSAAAPVLSTSQYIDEITADLDAGADRVILEGRESGTIGIFTPEGKPKDTLIATLLDRFSHRQLIFEAPQKSQQAWFIKTFGADLNFSNIPPGEVLPLATLRAGLRGDTFGAVGATRLAD